MSSYTDKELEAAAILLSFSGMHNAVYQITGTKPILRNSFITASSVQAENMKGPIDSDPPQSSKHIHATSLSDSEATDIEDTDCLQIISSKPSKPSKSRSKKVCFTKGINKSRRASKNLKLGICEHCNYTGTTPQWRHFPEIVESVCNACGLFITKLCKIYKKEDVIKILTNIRESGDFNNRKISDVARFYPNNVPAKTQKSD